MGKYWGGGFVYSEVFRFVDWEGNKIDYRAIGFRKAMESLKDHLLICKRLAYISKTVSGGFNKLARSTHESTWCLS